MIGQAFPSRNLECLDKKCALESVRPEADLSMKVSSGEPVYRQPVTGLRVGIFPAVISNGGSGRRYCCGWRKDSAIRK